MEYRYRISQDELKRLYETAQARMNEHPEFADKQKKRIQDCPYFMTEREALENAIDMMKKNFSDYQIWAKIEKDGDIYRIVNWWIVTDDGKTQQSADYIEMALMYDNTRLLRIISNKIKIDDIVPNGYYYKPFKTQNEPKTEKSMKKVLFIIVLLAASLTASAQELVLCPEGFSASGAMMMYWETDNTDDIGRADDGAMWHLQRKDGVVTFWIDVPPLNLYNLSRMQWPVEVVATVTTMPNKMKVYCVQNLEWRHLYIMEYEEGKFLVKLHSERLSTERQ